MAFQRGQSKHPLSGRKRGVKNKVHVPKIADVLADQGLEPVSELLRILPGLELRDQAKIWMDLISYVHAKPKPEEPTQAGEDAEDSASCVLDILSDETLLRLVKDEERRVLEGAASEIELID